MIQMEEPLLSPIQQTTVNVTTSVSPFNDSDLQNHNDINAGVPYDSTFATMIQIEKYLLPFICIFGLIGNTLSTITFLQPRIRKAPCSLYLATRGISDNGFLLSLLLTWISSTFNLRLSQVHGMCQTIIFMTYVCGFVSVWLCVFITFENFLLIQNPFLSRRACCPNIPKICIGILVLVAVGFYNMVLWIVNSDCSHKPEYTSLTQGLVYTDTLLTLVIPTIIIFLLISVISYKFLQIVRIRRLHTCLIEKITNGQRPVKHIIPIAKVTKMLFVVSLTFFALNVPSHTLRLRLLIGTFTKGGTTTPMLTATLQSVFFLFYYLSFSVNILVYATFGSNFRRMFMQTFRRHTSSFGSKHITMEAVNLVHSRRNYVDINNDLNETRQYLMNTDELRASQQSTH